MYQNYFEGTLQLRNCSEEVKDFVSQQMKQKNVMVAKTTQRKNGIDYKVSSNKFLLQLKNDLPKRFPGRINLTRKLFSRDHLTQKNIYRLTLLFEQLPYKVGEVIDYRGDKVRVVTIGKKITVKDMKTGKNFFIQN